MIITKKQVGFFSIGLLAGASINLFFGEIGFKLMCFAIVAVSHLCPDEIKLFEKEIEDHLIN